MQRRRGVMNLRLGQLPDGTAVLVEQDDRSVVRMHSCQRPISPPSSPPDPD
jgi:hypothetical protein